MALYSVLRANGDLHFHFINPKTGHRVRMVTLDAGTDHEVARNDLVKGYEFEKDCYVLLDDKDFASARIESSSMMTVSKFVPRDAIRPIYFDTSYYMVPDGKAGQDIYIVLRDAIAKSGMAALSRLVIDLMAALKRSLGHETKPAKKPKRTTARTTATRKRG